MNKNDKHSQNDSKLNKILSIHENCNKSYLKKTKTNENVKNTRN